MGGKYAGAPCPVPKCKGHLKYNEDKDRYECDYGHLIGWKDGKIRSNLSGERS